MNLTRWMALIVASILIGLSSARSEAQWSAAPGASDCQLQLQLPSANWIVDGHGAFDLRPAAGVLDLTLVNDGAAACIVRLDLGTEGEPFGLSFDHNRRVSYTLIDMTDGIDLTPTTGRTRSDPNRRPITVGPHSQSLVQLEFRSTSDFLGDGLFSQTLRFEATRLNGEVMATRNMIIGVRIAPSITLALSGAFKRFQGGADVDLGELTSGIAKLPLNLHIQSTRGYRVSAQSASGGRLLMADGLWSIPYRIVIGGEVINANGGSYSNRKLVRMQIEDLALGFEVGEIRDRRAGIYSDIMTLEISIE